MGEIKSAKSVANGHVKSINRANTCFSSVGSASALGSQINKPTDAMRATFNNANGIYGNLSSSFGRDIGKINLMAEEFELWDNQVGKKNG